MKFYSEKTGNLYNNINELKAAENAFEEEQNKKQNEQRAKDEEKTRLKNKIKELEDLYTQKRDECSKIYHEIQKRGTPFSLQNEKAYMHICHCHYNYLPRGGSIKKSVQLVFVPVPLSFVRLCVKPCQS